MDAGRRAGSGEERREPGRGPRVWKEEGRLGHGAPGLRSRGRGTPPAPKGRLTVARNSDRPHFREETWMESPKVASAAGGDASRRPAPPTKAMPARLVFLRSPGGPRGRYLWGDGRPVSIARRSLSSSALSLASSLQQDLGAVVRRELGQGQGGGGEYTVAGAGLGESQA